MKKVILDLIGLTQAKDKNVFEKALSDLRYVIDRFTMDRYSVDEEADYSSIFYNKNLVECRLKSEELNYITHYLFFALFNFPDRAVLIAKCIKSLFDISVREAICTAIECYM